METMEETPNPPQEAHGIRTARNHRLAKCLQRARGMVEQRSESDECGLQEEILRLPRIGESAIRSKVHWTDSSKINRRDTEPYVRWCERWRERSLRLLDLLLMQRCRGCDFYHYGEITAENQTLLSAETRQSSPQYLCDFSSQASQQKCWALQGA